MLSIRVCLKNKQYLNLNKLTKTLLFKQKITGGSYTKP